MTKTEMELTKQENNIYFTWKPHVAYNGNDMQCTFIKNQKLKCI